jgi:Na+-transporting methylmalonyl-CoA/oxaloacetate decarboxylase gamma subunit
MNDFKLKLILSVLGGIVFSFIFILLAFVLPIDKQQQITLKKPQGLLEQVSQSARDK